MMLMEKGANIHEKDNDGNTSFHIAAQNGHTETASMLMEKGANIHEKDKKKLSILILTTPFANRSSTITFSFMITTTKCMH